MSPDAWQLVGVIVLLVGAIYAGIRYEQRRQAANVHKLRSTVQAIIVALAARGIVVRREDD